jgi:HEAT repeat protein
MAAPTTKRTWYFVLIALLFLGGAMPAQGADVPVTFLGRAHDQWVARLQSQQQHERVEAAWALSQIVVHHPPLAAESASQTALIALQSDRDPTIRYWGIHGLQRLVLTKPGPKAIHPAVYEALRAALQDESAAPRIAAAETLGLIAEADDALNVLTAAMGDSQDAVRIQAVSALEKLGEAARPAEAKLRAATSDSSEYVKRISTRALQKLNASK